MSYLDEAGHELVTQAVANAEQHTSGEIVAVLADRSDGYTDVALSWAVALAFTAMSVVAVVPDLFTGAIDRIDGGWGIVWTDRKVISLAIGIGVITFFASLLLQLWQGLKFAIIPSPVKSMRARDAAVRLFKVGAEQRTHGYTGVLLYLSMREHRAEIVADAPIAELVPAEVWGEAMVDMLAEVSRGRIADGLAAGVRDVGLVLAEHFPRKADDENELPDRLIEV